MVKEILQQAFDASVEWNSRAHLDGKYFQTGHLQFVLFFFVIYLTDYGDFEVFFKFRDDLNYI